MNPSVIESAKTAPANQMTATATVLFVDDYEALRNFVQSVLEQYGYRCTTAANAAEARGRLKEQTFDLAVLDVRMPGESGLDLAKYIRKEFPDIAVLMATGEDDLRVADSALKAGACGYLVKPFEANQLLINVASVLDRQRLEKENRQLRNELERLAKARTVEAQEVAQRSSQSTRDLPATPEKPGCPAVSL
jgi:putative two-component system response regulator